MAGETIKTNLREGKMIGRHIIGQAKEMIGKLLDDNLDRIDAAYIGSDGGLTISLSIKIEPSKRTGFQVLETGINFVVDRAKNQIAKEVSEAQDPLFKAIENMRPKKGSGIDSVTISCPQTGQSVKLEAKEK